MSAPAQIPGQSRPKTPRRGRREQGRTVVLLILAVLITLFAVLNVHDVKVHLIFGSHELPLIIVIVISLLVGMLLGYAASRRGGKVKGGKGSQP
jgi:uncharacterized integral membrane protein